MRWRIKIVSTIIAMLALLPTGGCGSQEQPDAAAPADVNLVLKVAVTEPGSVATRAESVPNDTTYFEGPATQYETVNTLRIIITRPRILENKDTAWIVEHNRIESFSPHAPAAGEEYGDFVFKVQLGDDDKADSEKKRIYIIANEASITPAINLTAGCYSIGSELTFESMSDLLIYSQWTPGNTQDKKDLASPYIDNENPDGMSKYVPMTEFFDVTINRDKSSPNAVTTQTEHLFITRSVVKFQFEIVVEADGAGMADKLKNLEEFSVESITFQNLMQKEYLFPKKTVYSPAKYPLSTHSVQRIITSFETPGNADNLIRPFIFTPKYLGYNGTDNDGKPKSGIYKNIYSPQIYFCETENNNKDNEFFVDIVVRMADGEINTYKLKPMANLPTFPRNTFVKVVIHFKATEVNGEVDLVPYIGIELKPGFGFDKLLPGDHDKPADW